MKRSVKMKTISALIALCLVTAVNLSLFAVPAGAENSGIQLFASNKVSSVSYSASSSGFGANVSFIGSQSGDAYLELQKSDGTYVNSVSKSFSSSTLLSITKSVSVPKGSYKLYIEITFNDGSEYERTSTSTFKV